MRNSQKTNSKPCCMQLNFLFIPVLTSVQGGWIGIGRYFFCQNLTENSIPTYPGFYQPPKNLWFGPNNLLAGGAKKNVGPKVNNPARLFGGFIVFFQAGTPKGAPPQIFGATRCNPNLLEIPVLVGHLGRL